MVRFNTLKYRTLFYRKSASLKNVRVKIDLTKRRYEVLKNAITSVNGNKDVDYVMVLTLIVDLKLFLKIKDQVFQRY